MQPEQVTEQLVDFIGPLAGIVVISMILERALAFIFEWDWLELGPFKKFPSLKALVSLAASVVICANWDLDILQRLFAPPAQRSQATLFGELITGLVVAGGGSGAMKLFQDVLGFDRTTRQARVEAARAAAATDRIDKMVELAESMARARKVGVDVGDPIS